MMRTPQGRWQLSNPFDQVSRRDFLLFSFFVLGSSPFRSEQEAPTLSVDVRVINLLATVHNKQDEIVRDLQKDDFVLEEDGRPQTIRYFASESNLPLTLGLLVDTSLSQRRVLGEEQSASYRFLDQVLRPDKDLAFVIHFDRDVELLQDLTSSRKQLERALGSLEMPESLRRGGHNGPGSGPRSRGRVGGTSLYDAVLLASDELMKKQTGRKALILLTDGVDTGSKVTLDSAIEAAQRADTLVYAIRFADEQAYMMGGFPGGPHMGGMGRRRGGPSTFPQQVHPDGKKILKRLSQETGASYFDVSKKLSIEDIYRRLQDELRNQYSLGYSSDRSDSGGYRKIHLASKRKDLIVQTRDGYYANW
jgi:VWFA-related protein